MHDAETRALKRATLLLLLLSVARWGWAARVPVPDAQADGSVLSDLLSASADAAEEEERRSAPLGEGERIDPNAADEVQLDRLPGIGPATARAIVSARAAGVVFRSAEDLRAVRGIGSATIARIRSSLDLSGAPPRNEPRGRASPAGAAAPAFSSGPVDVNRADLDELQRLPGVGPAIAERILVARREQVFTEVGDLVRVRGIGPATVERLRPHVTVGRGP